MTDNDKQRERIAYWLSVAQYDLDTAETVLRGGRLLYVGFMCQQVIEKALKASYVLHCGGTPPYSHNLGYLGRECGLYQRLSEDQKAFLDRLEPLNIESRYPDHKKRVLDGLTQEWCEGLLMQTKELYTWLRALL